MPQPSARDLISAGFQELERAQSFLNDAQLEDLDTAALVACFREAPQPDKALLLLIRLLERAPDLAGLFADPDDGYRRAVPLVRLLGASQALGEFLIRHPDHTDLLWEDSGPDSAEQLPEEERGVLSLQSLRQRLMAVVGADPEDRMPQACLGETRSLQEAATALRVAYRRQLTHIALQDLAAPDPLAIQPLISRQLADAAGAAIDAALAVARADLASRQREAGQVELAVIGMGKCGARELNYISDVDVIFVHRAPDDLEGGLAGRLAVELASGISKVLGASVGEPALWEIDANLRPEGKDGPLSRTLDSHVEYYRRWAHGWEFQAQLKARPLAGSLSLGEDYMAGVSPMVWQSSAAEGFVENVQAMRRRVFENIPAQHAGREIKLGRGGLRDIEFTIQLLQLVHGRVDESLRVPDTLSAIAALEAGEYISSKDAAAASRCYRQLRLYEHRIQMINMRRTHLMPQKEAELRALAASVLPPGIGKRPAGEDVLNQWRAVVREVSAFHEIIFYRPLLSTTAVLSDDDVKLSAEAAQARLAALGYRDPQGAMRHIEALTQGVSRRATLQRRILPVMLGWFAEGVDPDRGLLAFRRLSESLGQSPWYLTMLRDSSVAAERLCHVLSSSRFISDMLEHMPEAAKWLGDDAELRPRGFETQWTEVQNALSRHSGDAEAAVRLARLVRQREVLRTAVADAAGLLQVEEVGRALAETDRVATLGALRVAEEEVFAAEGQHIEFLVVAMGRQGGREIAYGSDMDAMFVHRALPGADRSAADRQAQKLAARLTALLSKPVKPAVRGEFPLQLDADLRPEGKKGALSRSLDSFAEYYRRWMEIWERQALLRARPVAGSDQLAQDFLELINGVRYAEPPSPAQVREIRRIKARVESERLPRGADPARHVKLGRGGLSDVEWLIQLEQLQHAHQLRVLRTTSTMDAVNALVDQGLMSPDDARALAEAWVLCTRVRAAIMVYSGKTSDVLPSARHDLEAVSRWCGFPPGSARDFEEHYLRTTRRARQVFERLFYGD
ncbi:bifunctional [glutamine synthetase] adenylyltransferase/[glutamine synthetase]-adenylyl-L-tyrosine phosphorylase [Nesterenkonia flava]|uniref:Bifunctional [glutamine synthetase] adenylyltransferase/[glutamine synthetase]-adenylyl-L-tyrosine phosphorylase n=1 Tax=Nesterenkonia flava TaxID=469799 RepID=A0ABU1FPF5_9MICC|nr:bifunctional [glutamine synthetase] adenylyltransferase/[glutamine synthetase]-adenylyl-L-tyrosine phosphorylase [Nesterenkonia flava]MDR5710526.1 bifunctional [glutamine synthetase] adenylyltransferase/[glutamine synthetase]-adenylyl-L-tyrosine phosphorylase [Nesterenkonia flava]